MLGATTRARLAAIALEILALPLVTKQTAGPALLGSVLNAMLGATIRALLIRSALGLTDVIGIALITQEVGRAINPGDLTRGATTVT